MAKRPWKDIGRYGTVGLELILSMAVGYYVGRWIDGRFATHGWGARVGFLVGVYAGFRSLYKAAQHMQREAERRDREDQDRQP